MTLQNKVIAFTIGLSLVAGCASVVLVTDLIGERVERQLEATGAVLAETLAEGVVSLVVNDERLTGAHHPPRDAAFHGNDDRVHALKVGRFLKVEFAALTVYQQDRTVHRSGEVLARHDDAVQQGAQVQG